MPVSSYWEESKGDEKCTVCYKPIRDAIENSVRLISTKCFHVSHKECFLAHVMMQASKEQQITCPVDSCFKAISEEELNRCLGDQIKEYDDIMIDILVKKNPELARCMCGEIMLV